MAQNGLLKITLSAPENINDKPVPLWSHLNYPGCPKMACDTNKQAYD
jgi:hypothetical protein